MEARGRRLREWVDVNSEVADGFFLSVYGYLFVWVEDCFGAEGMR